MKVLASDCNTEPEAYTSMKGAAIIVMVKAQITSITIVLFHESTVDSWHSHLPVMLK
jgi:hypothetical protein